MQSIGFELQKILGIDKNSMGESSLSFKLLYKMVNISFILNVHKFNSMIIEKMLDLSQTETGIHHDAKTCVAL